MTSSEDRRARGWRGVGCGARAEKPIRRKGFGKSAHRSTVYARMQLRRMSGFRSVRIGLAAVMLAMAMAVPPAGYAVVEKPKPDALWEAFPLEPAPERASPPVPSASEPSTSPFVPPSAGRSQATTVTNANAPSEASGPGIIVVALAATLLLLVATVSVLSGRRLYTGKRHQKIHRAPLAGSGVAADLRLRASTPWGRDSDWLGADRSRTTRRSTGFARSRSIGGWRWKSCLLAAHAPQWAPRSEGRFVAFDGSFGTKTSLPRSSGPRPLWSRAYWSCT